MNRPPKTRSWIEKGVLVTRHPNGMITKQTVEQQQKMMNLMVKEKIMLDTKISASQSIIKLMNKTPLKVELSNLTSEMETYQTAILGLQKRINTIKEMIAKEEIDAIAEEENDIIEGNDTEQITP